MNRLQKTYEYDNAVDWSDSYGFENECDLDYQSDSYVYEDDWEHSAYAAEIPLSRRRKKDSYEDNWEHSCANAEIHIIRRRKTYAYDNAVQWSDSYEYDEDWDLDYKSDSYAYEDEEYWDHSYVYAENLSDCKEYKSEVPNEDHDDNDAFEDEEDWDHSYAYAENLSDCKEHETEVPNEDHDDNDAFEDDQVDDDASYLVPSDHVHRDASQTVENGDTKCNNVTSVTQASNILLKEIQPVKETIDVNGFQVFSSQVESVNHIFKRHQDIALAFRPKNQQIRRVYMNALLSLIEMLCKSTENLSEDDLSSAEVTLVDLIDAGFKLDWLKIKLFEVSEKKKIELGSEARIQTMEEELQKLKLMCLDLETKLQKEKDEALAARAPLSFNDVVG